MNDNAEFFLFPSDVNRDINPLKHIDHIVLIQDFKALTPKACRFFEFIIRHLYRVNERTISLTASEYIDLYNLDYRYGKRLFTEDAISLLNARNLHVLDGKKILSPIVGSMTFKRLVKKKSLVEFDVADRSSLASEIIVTLPSPINHDIENIKNHTNYFGTPFKYPLKAPAHKLYTLAKVALDIADFSCTAITYTKDEWNIILGSEHKKMATLARHFKFDKELTANTDIDGVFEPVTTEHYRLSDNPSYGQYRFRFWPGEPKSKFIDTNPPKLPYRSVLTKKHGSKEQLDWALETKSILEFHQSKLKLVGKNLSNFQQERLTEANLILKYLNPNF